MLVGSSVDYQNNMQKNLLKKLFTSWKILEALNPVHN